MRSRLRGRGCRVLLMRPAIVIRAMSASIAFGASAAVEIAAVFVIAAKRPAGGIAPGALARIAGVAFGRGASAVAAAKTSAVLTVAVKSARAAL